jgi:hypothetical protein
LSSVLLLLAATGMFSAEPAPAKLRSVDQVIRQEFKFQGVIQENEALPAFARVKTEDGQAEAIRLPNYVVRERPDQTLRWVDEALATRNRLSSGAMMKKDLTKRMRFEAILPLWLDLNVAGEPVLRLDVLRLGW